MKTDFIELTDRLERVVSRRIALRAVAPCDAWPLYAATRNPLFNKHLLWPQPPDESAVLARIDGIVDASRSGQLSALSAVRKDTGEWVSLFRFQPDLRDGEALEMGVWTHDRFWHGRLSIELVRLCIEAVFQNSSISRLVGSCDTNNRTSAHLMEAVGMSRSATFQCFTEEGTSISAQEFQILRADRAMQHADKAPRRTRRPLLVAGSSANVTAAAATTVAGYPVETI